MSELSKDSDNLQINSSTDHKVCDESRISLIHIMHAFNLFLCYTTTKIIETGANDNCVEINIPQIH